MSRQSNRIGDRNRNAIGAVPHAALTGNRVISPFVLFLENENATVQANSGSQSCSFGVWVGFLRAAGIRLASSRANLTIVPLFDSTIMSDPNAATIEATINTAISNIESYIANPVTVNITFAEMSSGLGQSQTYNASAAYSTYLSALQTNQVRSVDDTAALATLAAGPGNPVNSNTDITATLPLFRALGFSGANPPAGQPDSTISFNASEVNDSRPGSNSSDYDLESTVAHEMDEVLGSGGAGSQLNAVLAGTNTLTGPVGPLDLFRYSTRAREAIQLPRASPPTFRSMVARQIS